MKKRKTVLLFGGTVEGRKLYDFCRFQSIPVSLSVASDYGMQALGESVDASVHVGRLDEEAMERWLQTGDFALVIDATHPYAREVTANLKRACIAQNVPYLRLLRDRGDQSGALEFASVKDAADYLEKTAGKHSADDRQSGNRGICTAEPGEKAGICPYFAGGRTIAACRRAGVSGRNLLCMQGPFSADFTDATLREFGCRFLVTKIPAAPAVLPEKMEAARVQAHRSLVIADRKEDGLSLTQVQEYLVEWTGKKVGKDV